MNIIKTVQCEKSLATWWPVVKLPVQNTSVEWLIVCKGWFFYFCFSSGCREHSFLLLWISEDGKRSRKYKDIWTPAEAVCLQETMKSCDEDFGVWDVLQLGSTVFSKQQLYILCKCIVFAAFWSLYFITEWAEFPALFVHVFYRYTSTCRFPSIVSGWRWSVK